MERYKQLGRSQNTRQHSKFYVELTFYNTSFGLCEEHDRLKSEGKTASTTKIVAAYDGFDILRIAFYDKLLTSLFAKLLKLLTQMVILLTVGILLLVSKIAQYWERNYVHRVKL